MCRYAAAWGGIRPHVRRPPPPPPGGPHKWHQHSLNLTFVFGKLPLSYQYPTEEKTIWNYYNKKYNVEPTQNIDPRGTHFACLWIYIYTNYIYTTIYTTNQNIYFLKKNQNIQCWMYGCSACLDWDVCSHDWNSSNKSEIVNVTQVRIDAEMSLGERFVHVLIFYQYNSSFSEKIKSEIIRVVHPTSFLNNPTPT